MKIEVTNIFSTLLKEENLKIEFKGMKGVNLLLDILSSSANEKLQENSSLCIQVLVAGSTELKQEVGDTVIFSS
jgi:hypothetical protein